MNITVNLSEKEVAGIKKYLSETEDKKANNDDVKFYIQGVVSATIYAPQESVSDYINNQ